MSITVIIVPIVVGSWPTLCALASVAAAGLGFKMLGKTTKIMKDTANEIELTDETSKVIEESLEPEETLVFTRSGITVTFKKDVREKLSICVKGEKRSTEDLQRVGKLFLYRIKQQYAYQKVKDEMSKHGFNIVQETTDDRRIKLLLRRF